MNFRTIIKACVLATAILPISCEKDHAPLSVFEQERIPKEIENDFYSRHSDAEVTDAHVMAYDGSIVIDFLDAKGLECKAVYLEGEWQMTTRDLGENAFTADVPRSVRASFLSLGYRNPKFDIMDNTNRLMELKRRGIDHTVYDFRFATELQNGSFAHIQVIMNEDGLVLVNSMGYNKQELFMWTDNAPYDYIIERYPGADIRTFANYSGQHQFLFIHDGKVKTATFDMYPNDFSWKETRYDLDFTAVLPDGIMPAYEQWKADNPRYSDSTYDKILFRETRFFNYYGLQDTKRDDKVIWWYAVSLEE